MPTRQKRDHTPDPSILTITSTGKKKFYNEKGSITKLQYKCQQTKKESIPKIHRTKLLKVQDKKN